MGTALIVVIKMRTESGYRTSSDRDLCSEVSGSEKKGSKNECFWVKGSEDKGFNGKNCEDRGVANQTTTLGKGARKILIWSLRKVTL